MTLVRGISRPHLVALSVNCIVGAGILGLPSRAFALSGSYSLVAWLVCALLVCGIALCFAEVSSRYRESGGPYLYALRAFGPGVGFVTGWLTWLSRVLAYATVCNLLVDYAGVVTGGAVTGAWRAAVITGVVSGMTVLLAIGIRQTAWTSTILTLGKMGLLAALVAMGLLAEDRNPLAFGPAPAAGDMAATVATLLFAFFGFESAAMSAGETTDPQRNMPRAILESVAIATVCYVLVQYVAITSVPGLATSTRPLADLATAVVGPGGGSAVAVGAIAMMLGTMLAVLLGASRMLMAIGEQHQLPAAVGRVHPRLRTPVVAIAITAGAVLFASLLSTFMAAITITVTTRLLGYLVVCMAVPALRRADATPPVFTLPLGTTIATASTVVSAWLLTAATPAEFAATLIAAACGWLAWLAYARTRNRVAAASV
jgi:APA family basic amino acid/polyamine antiporter